MDSNKKAFWARPKFIIWTVVLVLLIVIILQNVEPTSIDVLFWSLPSIPKLVLILISMLLGSLMTLTVVYQRKRHREETFTPE